MKTVVSTHLQQWLDRIDALELRERLLLLASTIIVLYLLVDSLGLQPVLKSQQLAEQRIAELETRLNGLHQQARLYNYQSGDDPLAPRHEHRNRLRTRLAELDEQVNSQLGLLVEPAQATEVLEQMLLDHHGLRLKSLQASNGILHDLEEGADSDSRLDRYQLDMVVEGNYLDVLRYLQALEAMPWKFFWQKVEFQSGDYPHAETRLQLYTLGARHG